MNRKLSLMCGVALVAVAPLTARAQDVVVTPSDNTVVVPVTPTDTGMGGNMGTDMGMTGMMTPMQVTGEIVRYYVDRSGYVTAMDVQTADGVQMVRFSPSMGQRLYSTYPIGTKNASIYVMGSQAMGMNVVGMGMTAPTMTSMPMMVSDVQMLDSEPYIMSGAKMMTVKGKLTDLIVNARGEVVGMVLDNNSLVRVPREVRNIAPGVAGTDRVTPLFKGANVEVTGYPEAPRYGVVSAFANRVVTSALVVNGRAVGAVGVPMMSKEMSKSILNVNIGGADRSPEEVRAMGMGYTVYSPSGSTMMQGTGMDSNMESTTTDTSTTVTPAM